MGESPSLIAVVKKMPPGGGGEEGTVKSSGEVLRRDYWGSVMLARCHAFLGAKPFLRK